MKYSIQDLKQKGKLILTSSTKLKVHEARRVLASKGYEPGELTYNSETTFIFDTGEDLRLNAQPVNEQEIKITNLIESYGASELPPAPKEITDPEPSVEQEKKTTTRRRRNTRRKASKTTETSE